MQIRFALYNDDPAFALHKAHEEDACYDLVARSFLLCNDLATEGERMVLPPHDRCLAKTGVFVQLEPGWEALVRPRSGNALKKGLTVLNTPGTIDAGYRNEIGVILYNAGQKALSLEKGMKVAQIAFRRIPDFSVECIRYSDFSTDTARNLKGFGSSGE